MVELALVAPLFVALILWGNYLFEVAGARIKQQEVTRFLAWEIASHPLSDLVGGDHAASFRRARDASVAETIRRYRVLAGHSHRSESRGMVARATLAEDGVSAEPVGLDATGRIALAGGDPMGSFHEIVGVVGSAQRPLLERFHLNVDHIGATSSVRVVIENRLMPRSLAGAWPDFFPERFDRLELAPTPMMLQSDSWYLPDGRDAGLGSSSLLQRQVDRIALLGLGAELSRRAGKVAKVLEWFPIQVRAQVVSQQYGDPDSDSSPLRSCPGGNPLARTGKWRNGAPGSGTPADEMSKEKCFDTLPINANRIGAGYRGDPNFRILESRGNSYMGGRFPAASPGRDS